VALRHLRILRVIDSGGLIYASILNADCPSGARLMCNGSLSRFDAENWALAFPGGETFLTNAVTPHGHTDHPYNPGFAAA